MKKAFAAILCLLLTAVFGGCTKEIPISTSSGSTYSVVQVSTVPEYAGHTAQPGNKLLLVAIEGNENELDNIQDTFFSDTNGHVSVTDGTMNAESELVVYAPQTGDVVDAIFLFEVSDTFLDHFTLYGDGFEALALDVEK